MGLAEGKGERGVAATADGADELAVFVVATLANHQQRWPESEFGMVDDAGVVAIGDPLGEADDVFQPGDHGVDVAAAHGRIKARRFGLCGHGNLPGLVGMRRDYARRVRCRLEDLLPCGSGVVRPCQPRIDPRHAAGPGGRRFTGKVRELPGQMRLIGVAAFRCDAGPAA